MDRKINEDIRERPNHAHYPICRGRLSDIKSNSVKVFFYTLSVCLIMAFFSGLCIPLHVIGWLPMLFNASEVSKGAFNVSFGFGFIQILVCVVFVVFAALNMGKRKVFGIVLFIFYAAMLISSLLVRLTGFDAITTLIGILGVYMCRGVFRDKRDYEQLSETEGFPMFNVVLAEYDDQKGQQPFIQTQQGRNYYNQRNQNTAAPVMSQSQSIAKPASALGNMPGLTASTISHSEARSDRFKPKGEKEGTILFSPMKLR